MASLDVHHQQMGSSHSQTNLASQSKARIKLRIRELRKASNIPFDEGLFISILLCLVSGGDRHLILTCPQESVKEVQWMAEQICYSIFGLATSSVHCDPVQTPQDFIPLLFTRSRDDSVQNTFSHLAATSSEDRTSRQIFHKDSNVRRQSSTAAAKPARRDASTTLHASRRRHKKDSRNRDTPQDQEMHLSSSRTSTNTSIAEDEPSDSESPSFAADDPPSNRPVNSNTSRSSRTPSSFLNPPSGTSPPQSSGPSNANISPPPPALINYHPITPSDFTIPIPKKRRESSATHLSVRPSSDFGDMVAEKPGSSSGAGPAASKRIAQAVVLEGVEKTGGLIQAALLELLIRKQVIDRGVSFGLPKPFVLIAVLPLSRSRHKLSSQLIDRFYISYSFEGPLLPVPTFRPTHLGRKAALFKASEIEDLAVRMNDVHVDDDITRYGRDIIIALRMHPKVHGGITARTSIDFFMTIRALAAVFQRSFITPELVLVASSRVFHHRLILENSEDDGYHGGSRTTTDIIDDVLEVVWPPV